MVLVIFGPPGSGKGTQAQMLAWQDGFVHISTGALLRKEIEESTPLGESIKSLVNSGQLAPDELVLNLVEKAFINHPQQNIVLDGIPRTIQQAIDLDNLVALQQRKVDLVVDLIIEEHQLIKRILGRYACGSCGAIYHEARPVVGGICNRCGSKEFQRRNDDTIETLLSRIQVYEDKVAPLREYYANQGKLRRVEAVMEPELVRGQIKSYITN